ncbi:uncharacterized protein AMSG_03426 [Thecamonas trahens ATCC 50062]|uniref:PH domain-containing protein n=1 Tax=Thecamonas trahens ATCC 50062 TaxID=461836 RepID=A0A0L0D6S1_THETB|nr:hypothetical protein AMSG_03426 [Thecamonas trahens ATCC 50062]KNC47003.1 hypothetical protein AMSG_03426 [Thecamonas trahens ATCC 50062]|eukprot:XP_013759786.1 hypothetical protein AMSG_03426 [Thecamonas trahens ATCC 50062]
METLLAVLHTPLGAVGGVLAWSGVFLFGIVSGALLATAGIAYFLLFASSKAIVFADGVSTTAPGASYVRLTDADAAYAGHAPLSDADAEMLHGAGVEVIDADAASVAGLGALVHNLTDLGAYLTVLRRRRKHGAAPTRGDATVRARARNASEAFRAAEHNPDARVAKADIIIREGLVDMIGGRFRTWKHRFLVVVDGLLKVYNKKGTELRYEVQLREAVLKEDANRDPSNHTFILALPTHTSGPRTDEAHVEYFRCADADDRAAWIVALTRAISGARALATDSDSDDGMAAFSRPATAPSTPKATSRPLGLDSASSTIPDLAHADDYSTLDSDWAGGARTRASSSSAAAAAATADNDAGLPQVPFGAPVWESAEWLNTLLPLFYHDLVISRRIAQYENYMRLKFAHLLNAIEKPNFVSTFVVSHFELGSDPPVVESVKAYPFDDARDELTLRAHIHLPASTTMTISTTIFGAIPVVVTVDVSQVTGEIEIVLPGSLNRLSTLAFVRPPHLAVRIVSRIGKKEQVKNIPLLAEFLTSRIHAEVARQFVAPHKRYFSIPFNGRPFALYSDEQMLQLARGLPLERDEYFYDEDSMAAFVGSHPRTHSERSSEASVSTAPWRSFKAGFLYVALPNAPPTTAGSMYVVLSGSTLALYASRAEPEPERVLNLHDAFVDFVPAARDGAEAAHGFPWRLDVNGVHAVDLYAASAVERTEWIAALRAVGGQVDEAWLELELAARHAAATTIQAWARGLGARARLAAIRARRELLGILIESEASYVADLDTLVTGYRAPLLAALGSDEPILFSADEIDAVTGTGSSQLLVLHRTLLTQLTSKAAAWNAYTTLGDAFVALAHDGKSLFKAYGKNVAICVSRLSRAQARAPAFASFLQTRELTDGLVGLSPLLNKPMYRLEKYAILLRNVLAHTQRLVRHHDLVLLDTAIRNIEAAAASMHSAADRAGAALAATIT